MQLYIDMATEAIKYKENSINIEYKKKEPIFLESITSKDSSHEALISFYDFVCENKVNMDYPLAAILSKEDIESGSPLYVYQYYLKAMNEHKTHISLKVSMQFSMKDVPMRNIH